jgi:hypothetical protein
MFGNLVGEVVLGTTKRTPFTDIKGAQALADAVGGEVRKTVDSGREAYVVSKQYNIDASDLVEPTDLGDVSSGILKFLTSTTRNTTDYLDGILKWGEANNAKNIADISAEYKRVSSQTSKQNRADVNAIYRELRDDPSHNQRREPLTRAEFTTRYTEKNNGRGPNQKVLDYWKVIQDLSDADFMINADRILKEAVANGETMVKLDGEFFRAKRVKNTDGNPVWDMDKKAWRYLEEGEEAFAVKDYAYTPIGTDGAVDFVVGRNLTTRRLFHSDVMSYNVGGHRTYADKFSFIIKQRAQIKLADGRVADAKPRAWMGVRTQAEAQKTMDQWNNIARAVADDADSVTDDFIKANNDWNPEISTKDGYLQFAEEQGLDAAKEVSWAGDGAKLIDEGGEATKFAGESTFGDIFRTSLNNRARSSRPLMGYGTGEALNTIDPTAAIEKGLAYSLNREAHSQYLNRASKGLLEAIRKEEKNGKVHTANWSATPDLLWERKKLNAGANFVYGKQDTVAAMVGKKNAKRMQKTVDVMADLDYPGFVRSAAFHTKLALLSVDQFMVQASQAVNAAAIASKNLGAAGAVRVLAGSVPMQWALAASDDVAKRIAARQAPITGISADDFMELRQWVNKTGRAVIDRTVIEENRDSYLGGGRKAQISNISTTFFRWGEVNARMSAALLNVAELRAAGYKGSFFRQDISQKMFSRQDILTASMTAASSAGWQRGSLAIPLQFMTYNMRIAEQLFTPDVLSVAERQRLAITHLALYGAASVPIAGALVDKYGYNNAIDPNDGTYHAIRYGAMDFAISQLVESVGGTHKTALSTRIGVGEGLTQFFTDFGTETLIEAAKGPGGQVIDDSITAMAHIISGLLDPNYNMTGYDFNKFARIISSYDDGFKYWAAKNYGDYWTRTTGTVTMNNLNAVDGIVQALGLPLAASDQIWADIGNESSRKEQTEKVYKLVVEQARVAARMYESGRREEGHDVMATINFAIMGLNSNRERDTARQRILRQGDLPDVLATQVLRNGNIDLANRMKELNR